MESELTLWREPTQTAAQVQHTHKLHTHTYKYIYGTTEQHHAEQRVTSAERVKPFMYTVSTSIYYDYSIHTNIEYECV